MAVGSLQSESQSHVGGTNKFSINRRRRATIAPISLSRRRDGAYRISVVEITLKYATRMTGTRLSTESLKINHTVAGSSARYRDVNPWIIGPVARKKPCKRRGKITRRRGVLAQHREDGKFGNAEKINPAKPDTVCESSACVRPCAARYRSTNIGRWTRGEEEKQPVLG